nr:heme-binding protein [Marinicella sp. W31]MDC2875489.1 heme-binding protein [Marinicella sp. W31]
MKARKHLAESREKEFQLTNTRPATALSHKGVMTALAAAIAKAEEIKVPQNVVIVDQSGVTLAVFRMDGAKFTSMKTARAKAITAASLNTATGNMAPEFASAAAIATDGEVINLKGGFPIRFDGLLAGAIGIGSGTGEQDVVVATAALEAIGADKL